MNNIKCTPLIGVLLVCSFGISLSQSTVSPTGADASGIDGSVSYTIGQIDYLTNTGSGGTITEGVQQPWEILVISETPGMTLKHTVYPNPTTEFVTLKIDGYQLDNLSYQLYDNNGKLIKEKKIESGETDISLKNFMDAVYYLKVVENSTAVSVYKLTINK